jgi:hypothetical protein
LKSNNPSSDRLLWSLMTLAKAELLDQDRLRFMLPPGARCPRAPHGASEM